MSSDRADFGFCRIKINKWNEKRLLLRDEMQFTRDETIFFRTEMLVMGTLVTFLKLSTRVSM